MTNYAETDSQLDTITRTSSATVVASHGYERLKTRVQALLVRRRTSLGLVTALALVAVAQPVPTLLYTGIALMLLAHGLRVISTGYIDKDEQLATAGPFAWCRNPLYVANLMVVVAFTLMSGRLIVLPVMVLLWWLTHAPTVACEEQFLRRRFGAQFERYCEVVPRWIPRRPTNSNTERFSWRRVLNNAEHQNILSAWIFVAMFFVRLLMR